MDESWRMKMGMPFTTATKTRLNIEKELEADDFSDVFGGPPRSVLHRQFSGTEYTRSSSSTNMLYEDVFRQPARSCRNLPVFETRGRRHDGGFYGDVFGCEEEDEMVRRSRTRSKASSSSALSSEEVSPLRPDDVFSFFAPKLRPINVPSRSNSTRRMHEDYQRMPVFSCHPPSYNSRSDHSEDFRSTYPVFNQRNSSPESISANPNSYSSHKVPTDALELNSPSSVFSSSLCRDYNASKVCGNQNDMAQLEISEQDEDEVMSSYVIEINPEYTEGTEEEIAVNEAIAWAKEKSQGHCSNNNLRMEDDKRSSGETEEVSIVDQFPDEVRDGHEFNEATTDEEQDKWATGGERLQLQDDMEMELLDEKVRVWSTGKEADIGLLLSTLHQIVWDESGWIPVPLTSLIDSSQVKKAYQKARLCLHPDKLQQRSATLPQKHVAHKAFSILQDAWEAFLSRNALLSDREYIKGREVK